MDFQPSGCPESGKKCTQSHRACVGPQTDTHPLRSSKLSASDTQHHCGPGSSLCHLSRCLSGAVFPELFVSQSQIGVPC